MTAPSGRSFCSCSNPALILGQPVHHRVNKNEATQTWPRKSLRVIAVPLRSVREKSATGPKSSAGLSFPESCKIGVVSLEAPRGGGLPEPVVQPAMLKIWRTKAMDAIYGIRCMDSL